MNFIVLIAPHNAEIGREANPFHSDVVRYGADRQGTWYYRPRGYCTQVVLLAKTIQFQCHTGFGARESNAASSVPHIATQEA